MSSWITSIIEKGSYAGVVFLMVLENIFPPIPSELIMPLAGFVSTQGQMTFFGIVMAGTAGSVLGALPLYYLGRWVGEKRMRHWIDRHGHWLALSTSDLDKANRWFQRHGGKTVLLCRVIPGVRSIISIPAGFAHMTMPLFLVYTTFGSAVWTTALAWAGARLGQNYHEVEKYVGPVSTVVIAGIVGAFVIRVLRQRARRRHA